MSRFFILTTIVFAFFACDKKSTFSGIAGLPPVNPMGPVSGSHSFLALGDSYTIGQSVAAADRFPAQTTALLRQQNVSISDPVYIARTGWTTTNLQAAIATDNPPNTFDVVTLLIGVNDQYQGRDTGSYAVRFTQLLDKAVQLARNDRRRVFVISIPDYSVTPFVETSEKAKVRREIDWFNEINKRITESLSISYTNITPSSREAASNPSLIADDGLHPSGLEYRKWAEMLMPKIEAALR